MREGIRGNGLSGIKYGHTHQVTLLFTSYINDLPGSRLHMVEGVAVIVLEDLLDQERIAPDIEGGFLVKLQCDIVLSGQQRSTFQVIPDHVHNIKALHGDFIGAEFKLVELQHLLHDDIHLVRFIDDRVKIERTALGIIRDSVLKSLCIASDQSNRCLELMRDIGEEFLPHFLLPVAAVQVALQIVVCRAQGGDGLFQFLRQFVHVPPQNIQFRTVFPVVFGTEIQLFHPYGNISQLPDGLGDPAGEPESKEGTDHSKNDTHITGKAVGGMGAAADVLQRCAQQKEAALPERPPHFQASGPGPFFQHNIDRIGLFFFQNLCDHIFVFIKKPVRLLFVIGIVESVSVPGTPRRFAAGEMLDILVILVITTLGGFLLDRCQVKYIGVQTLFHQHFIRRPDLDSPGVGIHYQKAHVALPEGLTHGQIKLIRRKQFLDRSVLQVLIDPCQRFFSV